MPMEQAYQELMPGWSRRLQVMWVGRVLLSQDGTANHSVFSDPKHPARAVARGLHPDVAHRQHSHPGAEAPRMCLNKASVTSLISTGRSHASQPTWNIGVPPANDRR